MKRLLLLTTIVCVATVADVGAVQIDEPTTEENLTAGEMSPTGDVASGAKKNWYVTYLDKAVGLTDEQKRSMSGVIQARNQSMWDFQIRHAHELRAAGNALLAAYRSMDGDAIAKAQRDYQELQAPLHQLMKKSQDDLMQILTPEQRTRLREYQMMQAIQTMTVPVQLDDDQIRKIKAAWPKPGELTAGATVYEHAIQPVLTLDQKVTIAKHRASAFVKAAFARAELTEEQLKHAEAIGAELAEDPSVSPEDFRTTLSEEITALLTSEQKAAMKKPWTWNGAGAGGPGSQLEARDKTSGK